MLVRQKWLLRRAQRAEGLWSDHSILVGFGVLGATVLFGVAFAQGSSATVVTSALVAPDSPTPIGPLVAEALRRNADIAAARAESDAARQRIAPAAAFEDPMLELGVVNAPLPLSFRREDMTMKMLGLSQKLPFPGKRAMRRSVAAADSDSVALAVDETVNRVVRDVRVSYEELRLALKSKRLVSDTLATLNQLVSIAQSRYEVGQATQSDSLQAQIQLVKMQQELLRLDREEAIRRAELQALLGRADGDAAPIVPTGAALLDSPDDPDLIRARALDERPQLKSLAARIEKSDRELDLAHREYFPDFEVRFNYGQRERSLDGVPRDDMVSLTVAVNLPLWRRSRLEPRVAEATAMRRQALSMAESQRRETVSAIQREIATERQQRQSAQLYRGTLMPQATAAFDTSLSAYRVGRVDFLTLLEARMRIYEIALGEAEAIAAHNKSVAELNFLSGRAPDTDPLETSQP